MASSGETPACPECERHSIYRRTGKHLGDPETKWRCLRCGHEFDRPLMKRPRQTKRPDDERSHISEAGRAAIEWEEGD